MRKHMRMRKKVKRGIRRRQITHIQNLVRKIKRNRREEEEVAEQVRCRNTIPALITTGTLGMIVSIILEDRIIALEIAMADATNKEEEMEGIETLSTTRDERIINPAGVVAIATTIRILQAEAAEETALVRIKRNLTNTTTTTTTIITRQGVAEITTRGKATTLTPPGIAMGIRILASNITLIS